MPVWDEDGKQLQAYFIMERTDIKNNESSFGCLTGLDQHQYGCT
jgi:hypothetical protein